MSPPATPSEAFTPACARAEFLAGARTLAPLLVGVAPFGMIYGALAAQAGIPVLWACAMSFMVFGGASQMILIPLLVAGTPMPLAAAIVALVNLRHALYSATLAPHVRHLPPRFKLAIAYLLTDEAFAACVQRLERQASPAQHWFFIGAGLALWVCWQLSTWLGVFVGAHVPAHWPLDFFLPLTFIAIVVPLLRGPALVAAAAAGGMLSVLLAALPFKLGLSCAALGGVAAGMIVQRLHDKSFGPAGGQAGTR